MVTFDEIMKTLEEQHAATIVKNCLPTSVLEAKLAIKKHPSLELEIHETSDAGTCMTIRPKNHSSTTDDVMPKIVRLKGHTAVSSFFGRRKDGK